MLRADHERTSSSRSELSTTRGSKECRSRRCSAVRLTLQTVRVTVTLTPTTFRDLPFVIAAERAEHARDFVANWSEDQHAKAIIDADQDHSLVWSDDEPAGFILVAGLTSPHGSVELRRIVVVRPEREIGREAIRLVLARAFHDRRVHRVWLDVKPHNARARHVYSKIGFVEEGLLRDALRTGTRYESLIIMSMLRPEWEALT
jgi:diamine N-acetyltransferase